jgi:hypothetical protein
VPLIVKPNPRRARAFMDSPSERGHVQQRRLVPSPVLGRLFLVVGVIVLCLTLLAAFGA